MGKSCAIDLRVADSNPTGQLLIYIHNVFPVLTKTLCVDIQVHSTTAEQMSKI